MIYMVNRTSGLTDGRMICCKLHGAGGQVILRADEINAEQSRIRSAINVSMNSLNANDTVNTSGHSEIMLHQLPCLAWRIWLLAWFWKRPKYYRENMPSCMFLICCLLVLISVQLWKSTEPFRAFTVSRRFLVCCLTFRVLIWLGKRLVVPSPTVFSSMPCLRGISRRGSHSGNRGQPSRPVPEIVEPIASAPPSVQPPNQNRSVPMNSQQTSRFMFQSRLDRPVVTVTFTISVSEEESNQHSSTPSISSFSQDASVLLGDMTGIVFHADHMQEDVPVTEAPQHTPAPEMPQQADNPTQEDILVYGPSRRVTGELHLITNPDGTLVLDEDGMVTWATSPSQADEAMPTSPKHVD